MTIVRKVVSQAELKRALSIRLRVFVQEQGVPIKIELDADDQRATHFLAYFVGRAVGTARVVFSENQAKVGRMAVLKSFRNKGVGRELLERTVKLSWKKGADSIILHAQVPVVGFYEKRGFRCVGRAFVEAGIPHRKMVLARKFKGI